MNKLLKQAKKFIALPKKKASRPVLCTAYIDEEHIIATDSFHLIRVKHHQKVEEPYLHHYKPELTDMCLVSNYPDVTEFIPYDHHAACSKLIDINEWIHIHEEALVVAKEHEAKLVIVDGQNLRTHSMDKHGNKASYVRGIISMPDINETGYNCKFMLDALKVFKILKEEPTFYWYGPLRPMLLKSENIEALIVPVRIS